jgi:fluoride exporter
MKSIHLVALGEALGSVVRYKLSGLILYQTGGWRFPLGTFAINVVGCFVIGILAGLAVKDHFFSPELRVFLYTGIIGGFTTFSAFGMKPYIFCAVMNLPLLVAMSC